VAKHDNIFIPATLGHLPAWFQGVNIFLASANMLRLGEPRRRPVIVAVKNGYPH
jgi:hypothetical protein